MKKEFCNKYETVIIVDPKIQYIGDIKEKILKIIGDLNVEYFEDLGNKKLAYEIKGRKEGHYIRIEYYTKENEIIENLEKYFKINTDILKYITIRTKEAIQNDTEYDNLLYDILDIYTDNNWENEPLDEDEINCLAELLRLKLNLMNGNIIEKEYFEELDKLWEEK